MKIVSELLDKQLVDRQQRKIGRVDGIVVELRDDEARIVAIETGFAVAAARVSKQWERFAVAVGKKLGVRKTPRYRIAWEKVLDIGLDVDVDVDGAEGPPWAWERWIREHLLP